MLKSRLFLTTGVVGLAWAVAVAANAQAANDREAVTEVVVTAQKREERLIDVPISITAVSAETMAKAGLQDLRDLQMVTPGLLNVNNGLGFQPAIRGISNTGTSVGEEGNTALYVDDVYMPAQFAGLFELQNIQRVEVLKGPQGTLYGRNSTAGAIKVITFDPGFEAKLKARVSYGFKYDNKMLSLYGATPINDHLAVDLAVVHVDSDGYVKNIAPNNTTGDLASRNYSAVRSKLLWKPTDDFQYVIAASAYRSKDNAAYTLAPQGSPPRLIYRSRPGAVLPTKPWEVSYSVMPRLDTRGTSLSGTGVLDVGGVSIKSITSFVSDKGIFASDSDRTNLALSSFQSGAKTKALSQEIDVSSGGVSRLSWLTGVFIYHLDAGGIPTNVFGGDLVPSALASSSVSTGQTTSYAAFGDLTYEITDRLSVTAGARYTQEKKQFQSADIVRPAGIRVQSTQKTWSNASYRAIASYKPTSGSNAYLSYTTGFKSGVFNGTAFPSNPVDPEEITALEAGYKASIGGFLSLQAAAYRYNYKNIQLQSFDPSQGVLVITLSNAAQARVEGLEFDSQARLGDHFTLTTGLSYMPTAKYSKYPRAPVFVPIPATGGNATVTQDISGSRMIRAPKFTLSGGGAYNVDVAGGEFEASVNAAYNSGFYWQAGESAKQNSYTVVNATVGWKPSGRRYKVSLFGTNLTNVDYGIYQAQTAVGDSIAYGRPREMGVRLDFDW